MAQLTKPGGPFELSESEVQGVRMRVFANAPSSLAGVLESTRARGDADFLVYEQDRFGFADHLAIVAGLAQWLVAHHGVGKGDRIAIGMRNYPEWVMTFWPTQVLGAVAVTPIRLESKPSRPPESSSSRWTAEVSHRAS